jgi:hypothetical protein
MEKKAERIRSPLQGRIEWWIWILLAAGTGIGYGFFSREFALGVLLGGIIGIANFYWLSRDLGTLLGRQAAGEAPAKPKAFMLVRHYFRLVLTAGILFLVITRTPANVLGLLLGLSVVIAGVFLAVATMRYKNPLRRLKDKNASPFISG